MRTRTVSVVIPTYQRRQELSEVLDAIRADTYASEVIVVVDGCADGSLEYVQQLAVEDARIRPIWQPNAGEAAARQTGASAATGDVILFLDDDVVAGPDLAHGHASHHAEHDNLVVLGYMPTRRPTEVSVGSFTTDLYADEYEQACASYQRSPEQILLGLWAGNMSIRREHALRIGLDRGHRLGYHDDQEFGLRCHLAGLRGIFQPELAAEHIHVRDLPTFLRQARTAGLARRRLERNYAQLGLRLNPLLSLPPSLQAVVRVLSSPGLGTTLRSPIRKLASVSGAAGWHGVERASARLLRQVELHHGYRSQML